MQRSETYASLHIQMIGLNNGVGRFPFPLRLTLSSSSSLDISAVANCTNCFIKLYW